MAPLRRHRATSPIGEAWRHRLRSMCRARARAIDAYGAVEPGRRADLLLFDSDPLLDIRAVLGAKTVIKDGAIVKV